MSNEVRYLMIGRAGITTIKGLKSLGGFLVNILRSDLVFLNNPSFLDFFLIYVASKIRPSLYICGFDLILKKPEGYLDGIKAFLKVIFIRSFDLILTIHKDTYYYEKVYGIKKNIFQYVPFKANNYDYASTVEIIDRGYVVALGASQRDYVTFCEALEKTGLRGYVICSAESAKKHNAVLPVKSYPNIIIVDEFVSRDLWTKYIAESTIVVVPILQDTYQPAGISVYLEAMLLQKPVIVTKGSSVNGILNSDLAVLVEENSVEDMANNIQWLYEDPDQRAKLAFNGHKYAVGLGNDMRLRADIASTLSQCLDLCDERIK